MRNLLPSLLLGALLPAACSSNPEPILVPPTPTSSSSAIVSSQPAIADFLGERPVVATPEPFLPPVPEVFDGPEGSKVWLLERHGLPLLSIAAVVPSGASSDGKLTGRAYITADMLDEGTDKLDAAAFSRAIEDLGARMSSHADREKSVVRMEVLSSKFPDALALMGAAVTHPRHAEADWKRVSALWKNALIARGDEPSAVARLVTSTVLWGMDHPYGYPVEGTQESAKKISLKEVAHWHKILWNPSRVTFVVVGDIGRGKLEQEFGRAFAGWKASPHRDKMEAHLPTPPDAPKTIFVDRPGAPQITMTVARRSVAASDPNLPLLDLVNVALGGSFTSRLNQNLREEHGWTYGARSAFVGMRSGGIFLARAAIRSDAMEPALRETLGELKKMANDGPSEEEVQKVKALTRADAVDAYGSLSSVVESLVSSAALGLPPDQDARTLSAQGKATRDSLRSLAKDAFSIEKFTVLLVGPREPIEAALKANGLPSPEERDVEGRVVPPHKAKPLFLFGLH